MRVENEVRREAGSWLGGGVAAPPCQARIQPDPGKGRRATARHLVPARFSRGPRPANLSPGSVADAPRSWRPGERDDRRPNHAPVRSCDLTNQMHSQYMGVENGWYTPNSNVPDSNTHTFKRSAGKTCFPGANDSLPGPRAVFRAGDHACAGGCKALMHSKNA